MVQGVGSDDIVGLDGSIPLEGHYHSCEEIVYFSRDNSTTFIQFIQNTEVTANQLKS